MNATESPEASLHEILNSFRFYLEGVMLMPVSVTGIIGNILSMIVLSCHEMQSNFNHLLLGLATSDLIYLLMSTLIFAIPKLSTKYLLHVLPHIMPIGYGIAHVGRVGSVLMTLSVTIERFFAIVYPLKRIQLKSSLITTSIITAILYNIPRFFEFEKIYRHISTTNDHNETINNTVIQFAATDLRMNAVYIQVYVVWMKFIIVELGPYVSIIVLNALIIIKIRVAVRERQAMINGECSTLTSAPEDNTAAQKKERSMAVVLICIVVMFIVCQSVKIIPDMYEAAVCEHDGKTPCKSTALVEFLISLSHLLLAVNSASNFIIYMARGDKFRTVFTKLFIKGQCTKASRRERFRRNASTRVTFTASQRNFRKTEAAATAKDHGREAIGLVETRFSNRSPVTQRIIK